MPWAWWWSEVKQATTKTLESVTDKKKFSFRPYIHTLAGVTLLVLYEEHDR